MFYIAIENICSEITGYLIGILKLKKETESWFDSLTQIIKI